MALGRSYGAMKGDLLNFDVAAYPIPWWSVALQIVVGVLIPVVAAWIRVRRACRMPIAGGLRDYGVDRSADQFTDHWSVRIGGLTRPLLLSIRNAFRNRQRMTLTLLALALGGAVFLAAANLRASVIDSVGLLFEAQRYTFSVRLANAHDADSVESIVVERRGSGACRRLDRPSCRSTARRRCGRQRYQRGGSAGGNSASRAEDRRRALAAAG